MMETIGCMFKKPNNQFSEGLVNVSPPANRDRRVSWRGGFFFITFILPDIFIQFSYQ